MKWSGLYLVGYGVFLIGALLALWKMGVLASIGPVWTAIGVIIAIGLREQILRFAQDDRGKGCPHTSSATHRIDHRDTVGDG